MLPDDDRKRKIIEESRRKIDEIDRKLLKLLQERFCLAKDINSMREVIIDIPREKQIIENLKIINQKTATPLPDAALEIIFKEIISASRSLVRKLKVVYLGPVGSFTHEASVSYFGRSCEFVWVDSIADVFIEVEKGYADFGVVPIENSQEGSQKDTLDMFIDTNLNICGEIFIEINLCLLSNTSRIEEIKSIYSHPMVFMQCRKYLSENFADVELIETYSTAEAAKKVSMLKDNTSCAAVASKLAAEEYKLNILKENIEDSRDNVTRFFVIGKTQPKPTGNDKTSVLFSIKDTPGALYKALEPFAKKNINLTKIESRPSRKQPWEYIFFLDLDGHIKSQKVEGVLKELKDVSIYFKLLGSYPRASVVKK